MLSSPSTCFPSCKKPFGDVESNKPRTACYQYLLSFHLPAFSLGFKLARSQLTTVFLVSYLLTLQNGRTAQSHRPLCPLEWLHRLDRLPALPQEPTVGRDFLFLSRHR